eukprot:16182631-Heterocapsa_arctica.AAC.1
MGHGIRKRQATTIPYKYTHIIVYYIRRAFSPRGVLDSRCLHQLQNLDVLQRPAVLLKILIRGRPEPPVSIAYCTSGSP